MARACIKAGGKTWKCLHRAHKAPYLISSTGRWGNGEVRLREVTQNTNLRNVGDSVYELAIFSATQISIGANFHLFSPSLSPSHLGLPLLPLIYPLLACLLVKVSRSCSGWLQTHNPPDSTSLILTSIAGVAPRPVLNQYLLKYIITEKDFLC